MEFPLDDRRRRLPSTVPPGGHTARELHDAALDAGEIRHAVGYGTLTPLGRGIYAAGGVDGPAALLEALASASGAASHGTAAALLGFPEHELRLPVHLTTPTAGFRVQRAEVVPHRSDVPEDHIVERAGIRCTSPARTWVDLAQTLPPVGALVLADQILRPPRREFREVGEALAGPEELHEAVARRRGSRGIRQIRRVADLARVGVDSPRETALRYAVHRAGLPDPRVNPRIGDEPGWAFQPDLAFDAFRVAVQYEGTAVHSTSDQVLRDVRRADIAAVLGWVEVRITKEHSVDDWRPAIRKIVQALLSRGWTGR